MCHVYHWRKEVTAPFSVTNFCYVRLGRTFPTRSSSGLFIFVLKARGIHLILCCLVPSKRAFCGVRNCNWIAGIHFINGFCSQNLNAVISSFALIAHLMIQTAQTFCLGHHDLTCMALVKMWSGRMIIVYIFLQNINYELIILSLKDLVLKDVVTHPMGKRQTDMLLALISPDIDIHPHSLLNTGAFYFTYQVTSTSSLVERFEHAAWM